MYVMYAVNFGCYPQSLFSWLWLIVDNFCVDCRILLAATSQSLLMNSVDSASGNGPRSSTAPGARGRAFKGKGIFSSATEIANMDIVFRRKYMIQPILVLYTRILTRISYASSFPSIHLHHAPVGTAQYSYVPCVRPHLTETQEIRNRRLYPMDVHRGAPQDHGIHILQYVMAGLYQVALSDEIEGNLAWRGLDWKARSMQQSVVSSCRRGDPSHLGYLG